MRTCIECGENKLIESFPKNGKSRRTRCAPCYKVYNTNNKRAVYQSDRNREMTWLKKFKLTVEGYNKMLESQDGVCAICKQEETSSNRYGLKRFLAVDHNHACCDGTFSCGKCVRGLLCHKCNTMIGMANDDVVRLQEAIKYLGVEDK